MPLTVADTSITDDGSAVVRFTPLEQSVHCPESVLRRLVISCATYGVAVHHDPASGRFRASRVSVTPSVEGVTPVSMEKTERWYQVSRATRTIACWDSLERPSVVLDRATGRAFRLYGPDAADLYLRVYCRDRRTLTQVEFDRWLACGGETVGADAEFFHARSGSRSLRRKASKNMQKPHRLWRYNEITGMWDYCRTCEDATAKLWLEVWQKDEPKAHFKLSRNRPNGAPKR